MMTSWTLIIILYSGALTMDHITGFTSQQTCEAAGKATEILDDYSMNLLRYVCVEVK